MSPQSATPSAEQVEDYAARRAKSQSRRRRLARWLLVAMLFFTFAPPLFLATATGRRFVADAIESGLDKEIPGRVTIGRIERFGYARPVVHDLRFLHPNGQVVLHVKRAVIDLDVSGLLTGTVAFNNVKVDGGRLVLAIQEDGRTTLEGTVDRKGGGGGDGAKLAMRAIHVENFSLLIKPGGDAVFDLRDVKGFVGIWQDGPPGAKVRLDRISARLQRPEFLGSRLTILRADGWVHGAVEHVLSLSLRARLGEEPLQALLNYYDRDKTPVEITLDPGGVKGTLAALGGEIASAFTDVIDVKTR
jgi:hypothetical protein